jgi:protease-4
MANNEADKDRSTLTRIVVGIWRFIDGARKLALNLVFLLILFFIFATVWESGDSLVIQPRTALVISPYGDVVEQYSGTPFDQALQNATDQHPRETRLRDLIDAIRRARNDERIISLVIDPGYMEHVGLASLQELELAIAEFKTSGKPVIAVADNMTQQQYYLAATADEIWLQPQGLVWIDGFSAYRNFFHEGLDKLEVEINLFRVGSYKSAMEPFIRDDMSTEDREASLFWLGSLWQQYLEAVSRERGVPLVDLSTAVNQFADRLEAAGGSFAQLSLDLGLVDRLISRPEANQELAARGAADTEGNGFRQIGFDNYLALTGPANHSVDGNKVMIVVAEGEIVSGDAPSGMIGAETIAAQLRTVGNDAKARAVVLRMNSPGGESFASEQIRREVQALRESGKTVVVSMGDVAASGAYWIAMAGEEVWASPASITGSIGVFGMIPTFSRPLGKLGIHTDGVGTTPLAGKLRLDLPMDSDLKRIFQTATEHTYQEFIRIVSEGRNMPPDEVEKVAEGRVWSGAQAKELGLVDQTGTLQQAIDSAARVAGLGSDYEVQYSEPKLSPLEVFVLDMMSSGAARLGLLPSVTLRGTLLESLLSDLALLARRGSGFSLASHCLCQSP